MFAAFDAPVLSGEAVEPVVRVQRSPAIELEEDDLLLRRRAGREGRAGRLHDVWSDGVVSSRRPARPRSALRPGLRPVPATSRRLEQRERDRRGVALIDDGDDDRARRVSSAET
jgi:hypothetical protein